MLFVEFQGSAVTAELNDDVMDTFAAVFSKLSQRVLWKRDAKVQSGLGQNTKLLSWLPQNDLLGMYLCLRGH